MAESGMSKYSDGIILGLALALIGALLHVLIGPLHWENIGFPRNIILLLIWCGLVLTLFLLRKKSARIRWMMHAGAAIPSIAWCVVPTIILGLTTWNLLDFWSFSLEYAWMATVIALACLNHLSRFSVKEIPFLLNHLGLLAALVAGALGTGDMIKCDVNLKNGETISISTTQVVPEVSVASTAPVTPGSAASAAPISQASPVELTLHHFNMEVYPPELAVKGEGIKKGSFNGWKITTLEMIPDAAPDLDAATFPGPATDNPAGNATGNATDQVTGQVTGEATDNPADPVTGTATDNPAGHVTGNATGPATGPATGQVTGDATDNPAGHVTGDATGPATDHSTGIPTGAFATGKSYKPWFKSGACHAMLVKAEKDGVSATGWVTSGSWFFPPQSMELPDGSELVMLPDQSSGYFSEVSVRTPDGRTADGIIEVNKPLKVGPWRIIQKGYDTSMGRWSESSTLQVIKDPWGWVLDLGIYSMLIGAVLNFMKVARRKKEVEG